MTRVYPPQVMKAMLAGLRRQMIQDGELWELSSFDSGPVPEENPIAEVDDGVYYDDVNGGILLPELVREARRVELDWVMT